MNDSITAAIKASRERETEYSRSCKSDSAFIEQGSKWEPRFREALAVAIAEKDWDSDAQRGALTRIAAILEGKP